MVAAIVDSMLRAFCVTVARLELTICQEPITLAACLATVIPRGQLKIPVSAMP